MTDPIIIPEWLLWLLGSALFFENLASVFKLVNIWRMAKLARKAHRMQVEALDMVTTVSLARRDRDREKGNHGDHIHMVDECPTADDAAERFFGMDLAKPGGDKHIVLEPKRRPGAGGME